jgi:TolB protein
MIIQGLFFDSPSWSPDGEWLVFSTGTIQKIKINGDSLISFSGLDHLDNASFFSPNWTIDGKYILFGKNSAPDGGLYYANADFSQGGRIYGIEITSAGEPEISLDNFHFIYSGGGHSVEHTEIFLSDTLGTKNTQLTQNNQFNMNPTWSPNGEHISWSSSVKLNIMNTDGSDQHQIAYGNSPSWSVNDEIVYSYANTDFTKEVLFIINSNGQNKKQITF